MAWVLFTIILEADRYYVAPHGPFATMELCFEQRENFLRTAPLPKINYEAVCIRTDEVNGI